MKQSPIDDLDGFARRLATFGARSISLDRDALLFAAGQAATDRAHEKPRPSRVVRAWQVSTVAMTLLSAVLGSLLIWQPASTPQIVFVERQPQSEHISAAPAASQTPTPSMQLAADHVTDTIPPRNADDSQLAEAWKARREMIGASQQSERQLATTSSRMEIRNPIEEPLTRSSLLGERSQETIQRWLKEQL